MKLPKLPTDVHWLGDRLTASHTHHTCDARGVVMYFKTEAQCQAFMKWITNAASTTTK